MKKYKNDNPEFSNEIDIVEVTDPNHADNINKADKQIFENTLINKDNIEQLENNKVDKVDGKCLSTNDYTTADKNKLSGIADKANNYVHPVSHPADMIEQDTTHRFVSDNEKTSWNATLQSSKDYSDAAYRQSTGYTDKKIADLINGAPETLDTLKEVADAIQANKTVADALTAAVGKKANQAELDTHISNNTIHITSQERTNWNDANNKKHSHSNKSVLDGITSAFINTWNKVTDKLDKTGDASNTTTSFSTASIRSNIATGEKLSVSLGKIAKFFADLKTVAFTGSYTDLSNKPTSLPANGGNSATVNGHAVNVDVPANAEFTDTNTTYSAGTGIGLSNTTFYNTGVRSIATGSTNGTVAVNTNGTVAEVKVKGLNTLAYASGTWNKLTGTNCTLWYNEVAVYLEISAQNVNLKEYGGTATNKTIVVLPTNVIPTKGAFLGAISALNSAWVPLNKTVVCDLTYNSRNLILRPAEALSNVTLNLTAMFPRSLFTIK